MSVYNTYVHWKHFVQTRCLCRRTYRCECWAHICWTDRSIPPSVHLLWALSWTPFREWLCLLDSNPSTSLLSSKCLRRFCHCLRANPSDFWPHYPCLGSNAGNGWWRWERLDLRVNWVLARAVPTRIRSLEPNKWFCLTSDSVWRTQSSGHRCPLRWHVPHRTPCSTTEWHCQTHSRYPRSPRTF